VNAVLRDVVRTRPLHPAEDIPTGVLIETLDAQLSHPAWLLKHWAKQWSSDRAIQIAKLNNCPAPVYLWLNPLQGDTEGTRQQLEAAGVCLQPLERQPQTFQWIDGPFRELWKLVETGTAYIQDAGSQQIAQWLEVSPGMRILDACAAPGGKTAQLAALMNNQGSIIALDLHPHRVAELKANCARLGVRIVTAYATDATHSSLFSNERSKGVPKLPPASFDAVLVDAPCSGTGTLRRHPEMKWKLSAQKIVECSGIQSRLLKNVAQGVKPGGVLLFSTCSLEEREGEEVARIFLNQNRDFEVSPPGDAGEALTKEGFMRIWPDTGSDGFFAARFRRKL
jgi:16S rRNA (cytosine967-C5)-methyltransferase